MKERVSKYKIKISQNFQANKTKKIQSSISEELIKEEKMAARHKWPSNLLH